MSPEINSNRQTLDQTDRASVRESSSSVEWDYPCSAACPSEGLMTGLAADLLPVLPFDYLNVVERRRGAVHRIALQLRLGGKRVFRIRTVRKCGRMLVTMSGADPARVLDGIHVCRRHFDRWFDITSNDLQAAHPASADPSAPKT